MAKERQTMTKQELAKGAEPSNSRVFTNAAKKAPLQTLTVEDWFSVGAVLERYPELPRLTLPMFRC
jgi:hypothetical protein